MLRTLVAVARRSDCSQSLALPRWSSPRREPARLRRPTAARRTSRPPTWPSTRTRRTVAARPCRGPVLAAIGKVESDHGRLGGARLQPDGSVAPPIIGVALDGSPGVARILDTDRGRYDGDTTYDRAVGPMQFIPGTWTALRRGRDRQRQPPTPTTPIDAIHSAARYLCANGAERPDAAIRQAILAYNRSTAYRDRVLEIAAGYAPLAPAARPRVTDADRDGARKPPTRHLPGRSRRHRRRSHRRTRPHRAPTPQPGPHAAVTSLRGRPLPLRRRRRTTPAAVSRTTGTAAPSTSQQSTAAPCPPRT